MKKRILGLVVLVMGLLSVYGTDSTPSVVLVSAKQRYPWNNVVDYSYTLANLKGSVSYKLAVEITAGGVAKAVTNDLSVVADGTYTNSINLLSLCGDGTKDAGAKLKLSLLEFK